MIKCIHIIFCGRKAFFHVRPSFMWSNSECKMDIQKESRSPEKYNHEEAEQLAANTAKDLALKISLRNNIKDTKDFSIKVQKLDASEIRQIDKSLSKDLSPGPSK